MKFTEQETQQIEILYKTNLPKFFMIIVGTFIFGIAILFIPAKLLGRRASRANITESLFESLGVVESVLIVFALVTAAFFIANWLYKISNYRQDLEDKQKIITKLKVNRIEHLSEKDIKEIRELGTDTTDIIHFSDNAYDIKKYPFNREINPNLLETKAMILEIARTSKFEFKREIIK
jgi:heme/copper-type cytochrome/quinol oxidase subunit 1